MRRGFTLLELMVVIGIIVALAGLSYPVVNSVRANSQISATRELVSGIAAAIANYHAQYLTVSSGGSEQIRRIWDIDLDGILDGDPTLSDGRASLKAIAPSSYRGFLTMTAMNVPGWAIDRSRWELNDRWHNPIHIVWADRIYGPAGCNIWSYGPDGLSDGSVPATRTDDIMTWKHDD